MATSCLGTPKLRATISTSHHTFQNRLLHRRQPRSASLFFSSLCAVRPLFSCRLSVRAESSDNDADPRHYDFDLSTTGADSGGVRASRFAAGYGASVAVCELPFTTVSSDTAAELEELLCAILEHCYS